MCSLHVWIEFGRCFRISFLVKPGNEVRKPLLMVSTRVEDVGGPSDAWYNFSMSVFVVSERMIALLVWMKDASGVSFCNCTIHIPLV